MMSPFDHVAPAKLPAGHTATGAPPPRRLLRPARCAVSLREPPANQLAADWRAPGPAQGVRRRCRAIGGWNRLGDNAAVGAARARALPRAASSNRARVQEPPRSYP